MIPSLVGRCRCFKDKEEDEEPEVTTNANNMLMLHGVTSYLDRTTAYGTGSPCLAWLYLAR